MFDHVERQLAAASLEDAAAVQLRQLEDELLRGGSSGGPGECPIRLQRSIEGLHAANIIAVAAWPERRLAVTGSSDGSVAVVGYDGTLHRSVAASSSGVLCLALQRGGGGGGEASTPPAPTGSSSGNESASRDGLVAAGCMDGGVVLLDAGSGKVLARTRPHRKYCVR